MNRNSMSLAVAVALLVLASPPLSRAEGWWWSAGPVYRDGMSIDISGSSYVQEQMVHAASVYDRGPDGAGAEDQFGDREYEGGFIRADPGTPTDGLTWYWGYDDDAQYNAAAGTLSLAAGGGRRQTRAVTADADMDVSEDASGGGVIVEAGRRLMDFGKGGSLQLDVVAGLASVWGISGEAEESTYAESYQGYRYSEVDVYELEGVVPPAAPYAGTYDGPGPVIPNLPSSRERDVARTASLEARNHINVDVDAALQQIQVGPRFSADVGEKVALHLQPFVTLNYVDIEIDRTETFVVTRSDGSQEEVSRWTDSQSESEWLFGAGVKAGCRVALSKKWFVDVSVYGDWMDEAEADVGPSEVAVDLSGFGAALQVGCGF